MTWFDKLLEFLKVNLPGWLAMFGLGYKIGTKHEQDIQQKLDETTLKLKHEENENEVRHRYADKSAADIIADAIERTKSDKSKPPK